MTILAWYLLLFMIGLACLPLAGWLMRGYEDKGYAFSRILGLVILGMGHWYLVSLGLNVNNRLGAVASLSLMILAGLVGWIRNWNWLNPVKNWRTWILPELIFLVSFGVMILIRSLNPEISGTEKPMELAFVNAIIKSPNFPPADPWMSGYAISYYYFGYLVTAILSILSGVEGSLGFNLMIASVFGMAALSAYSIMARMLAADFFQMGKGNEHKKRISALLAPLFVLIISNAEGFLELLHSLGVGWNNGGVFWRWLNIKELIEAPAGPAGWNPRFWFWWRASRVISDYDLNGNHIEVIDEFPFFSFLLGDLHPHVLAIPIVLLLIGMAAEFFLRAKNSLEEEKPGFISNQRGFLLFYGFLLGTLGFTNTWDFPIYFGLILLLIIFFHYRSSTWDSGLILNSVLSLIWMLIMAFIPFLPFYVTFSSQAGGLLPNIAFPTSTPQLWVMFLPLFIPVFFLLITLNIQKETAWIKGMLAGTGLVLGLYLFSLLLGLVLQSAQPLGGINLYGADNFGGLVGSSADRRLREIGGLLTLITLIGLSLGVLLRKNVNRVDMDDFAVILSLLAGLLIIAPEFIYLRDQFGSRMNTVFKFYYQAWILLGLVAAYSIVRIGFIRNSFTRTGMLSLVLISTIIGFVYPLLALPQKLEFSSVGKFKETTLDGAAQLQRYQPEVYAATQWLSLQEQVVIAEAVGGSYTDYARMSTFSGQSAVLGWPGHESQWRGSYDLIPDRQKDIQLLYETDQWELARMILEKYGITFVVISDLERSTYQLQTNKFDEFLPLVWENGSVKIYQVKESLNAPW
ncbi:MAG TPA: DUF2298 domain-containing protein [Anaerolineales bacterium]|nr:DUF2298 domain-containing protein [Anaerolineales bacterium]